MPAKKSSKNKKKGNNEPKSKRHLVLKDDMQQYGQLTKSLGDRRFLIYCVDGSEIMGHIAGKFRKRLWFKVGDVVLISFREFQADKADIIYKYDENEVKTLVKQDEVPAFFLENPVNRVDTSTSNDILFNEDEDEDEDEDINLEEI